MRLISLSRVNPLDPLSLEETGAALGAFQGQLL